MACHQTEIKTSYNIRCLNFNIIKVCISFNQYNIREIILILYIQFPRTNKIFYIFHIFYVTSLTLK